MDVQRRCQKYSTRLGVYGSSDGVRIVGGRSKSCQFGKFGQPNPQHPVDQFVQKLSTAASNLSVEAPDRVDQFLVSC